MEHARGGLQKIMLDALRNTSDAPVLAWPLICGAAVAAKTHARELRNGVLRVEVADARWQAQLADLVPRYLAAINELAPGKVKRIEFFLPDQRPATSDQRP